MTYLQASLRGIPATIRRGNTITLEMSDLAVTPAFLPFYQAHRAAFDAWQRGQKEAPESQPTTNREANRPPTPRSPVQPTVYKHQPGLFD